MLKKLFYALLLAITVAVIWNRSLIWYGLNLGIGQLNIIWNARPISEVMDDPQFPDSLKAKLKLISEVRQYAIDSLGLMPTDNYTTVFDQKGDKVIWVIQACEPFRLEPKRWDFPVVGTVPYKGFFDKEKARKEREKLEAQGYDVSVSNPGGWSTLGWFTDPILSDMLTRHEGDLASLIIHEMVHATLWVKDSVDFNENLASFIGDTAAYQFLQHKYGIESKQYVTYLYQDQDYRRFSKYILGASAKLDSFYQQLDATLPLHEKKERKLAFIKDIVMNMDTLQLKLRKKPSAKFEKKLPNNAYFMNFRHYQSRQTDFEENLNNGFQGNLKAYIKFLSEKYPVN
jgi:predicted aminopeptidase